MTRGLELHFQPFSQGSRKRRTNSQSTVRGQIHNLVFFRILGFKFRIVRFHSSFELIHSTVNKIWPTCTWGPSCCGHRVTCSAPRPGFDPLYARLSPPRCLTSSWACRMSSGPWGIVVVRVSWPGHPRK